ncbi:MAG: hypothetical protein NTZ09_13915 [Candidatus Hydrogenedentes bacterium]|nr:hypothetical protein [Candidatus Hydrogenedentota bacterium]
MRYFRTILIGFLFCAVSASADQAFYRIIDLETGATVDVPRFNDKENADDLIGLNGARRVFYTLRTSGNEPSDGTLRTISYEGEVLEEKALPGLQFYRCDLGAAAIARSMSPNGKTLLYCAGYGGDVCSYDVTTLQRTPLLTGDVTAHWLGWAKDNRAVAALGTGIMLIDAGSGQVEKLSEADYAEVCRVSPDGRWLAFFDTYAEQPVMVVNLDSKEVFPVSVRGEDIVTNLCWSPDSTLLAYSVSFRGRIKAYSVVERKEVMSVDTMSAQSMFFLKNNQLAIKPAWAADYRQNAATMFTCDVPSGQMIKLPQEFVGQVLLLPGSSRVVCVFDPRWDKQKDAPIERYGTAAEKVFGTVLDVVGAATSLFGAKPPQVEIFDLSKEKKIGPPSVDAIECIIGVDSSAKTFRTAGYSRGEYLFRTITFDGEVKGSQKLPISAPGPTDNPSKMAWADTGNACVYYDERGEAIRRHDFASGQDEVLVPNLELSVAGMAWLNPDEVLLVVSDDDSDAGTWRRAIGRLNLTTRQMEKLCEGDNFFTEEKDKFALSPDGKYFAFMKEECLHLLDLAKKEDTVLVPKDEASFIRGMSWTGDGTGILLGMTTRTGYAPGYSPEEKKKFSGELDAKLASGEIDPNDPKQMQEVLDRLNGPRYLTECSVNLITIADKQIHKLAPVPEERFITAGPFLIDADRILYAYLPLRGRDAATSVPEQYVAVYNMKSQQEEKRIKLESANLIDKSEKLIYGIVDGKILFEPAWY